jgi:mannosyltransferase OCH1-like enzyme
MHFISIYSAYKLNNPDKIYIYIDRLQENNIFFNILKPIVTYELITPPETYNNIELTTYQYKADIIRMTKLIERGGIYQDLDIMSIKPLTGLLNNNIVLGSELSEDTYEDSIDLTKFKSITNAIIMSEPNNKFMIDWYAEMSNHMTDKPWAYHAVCLPKDMLLASNSYQVTLVSANTFMPFCFRKTYVWESDKKHMIDNLDKSLVIHLWDTIWRDYVNNLSVRYFLQEDNIITMLFKKYMFILKEHTSEINHIILNLINQDKDKNQDKINYYSDMLYWLNRTY